MMFRRCLAQLAVAVAIASSAPFQAQEQKAKPRTDDVWLRRPHPCDSFPSLSIDSTSPLPSTQVGADYEFQLKVSGGTPPLRIGTFQSDPATGAITGFNGKMDYAVGPLRKDGATYTGEKDLYYWKGAPGYSGPPIEPWHAANQYAKFDGLVINGYSGKIRGQPQIAGYFKLLIVVYDSCENHYPTWKQFVLEVKGPS